MANILLVEPDTTLGSVYKQALERAGNTVHWRKTAASAVNALDQLSIDVLILEIQMAVHNGIELLYEIRSYTDWNAVRVVLHTDIRSSRIDDRARRDLGIEQVLYKSDTSLAQLCEAVTASKVI
ncbi:response regulator [Candidatus Saccharibacteria bacterium]|nr:MAG: response regulator [Candidatus Saccharibacteria bacterium]